MEKKLICVTTKSSEETFAFAKSFAKIVTPPMVINLVGDLGAGKTTFTQGLLKALGVTEHITSPTFTILNEYNTTFPIYHFDMYRIEDASETENLGFEEYFDLGTLKGLTLVEWAENTPQLLPNKYLQITIKKLGDDVREFVVSSIEK